MNTANSSDVVANSSADQAPVISVGVSPPLTNPLGGEISPEEHLANVEEYMATHPVGEKSAALPVFPSWVTVLHADQVLGKVHAKAPLSKFKHSTEIQGVRDPKWYKPTSKSMIALASSMNNKGNLRMDTDPKVTYSPGANHLTLAGANRRMAIARAMFDDKIIGDVDVVCVIFPNEDLFEVAARDNSHRVEYEDMDRYRQIKLLSEKGTPIPNIATSMGLSADTVTRYISISKHPTLVAMLDGGMPYSKLAIISAKLEKNTQPVVDETMAFLKDWYTVTVPARIKLQEKQAEKDKKKVTDKQKEYGKQLQTGEFAGWIIDLVNGDPISGDIKKVAVDADLKGNLLKISSININLDKWKVPEVVNLYKDFHVKVLPKIAEAIASMKAKNQMIEGAALEEEINAMVYEKFGVVPATDSEPEQAPDTASVTSDANAEGEDNSLGFDADAT